MPGRYLPGGSIVSPSADDPLVRELAEIVGGPVGRYRAAPDFTAWRRTALILITALATLSMVLAVVLRNHCRGTLWKAPDQFTHLCYSDIPALYSAGGLVDGLMPYLQAPSGGHLAQPVGTGGLLALLMVLTPGGGSELRWVFDAAAVLLTGCLIATALAVAVLAGRRAYDGALVAASPIVAAGALISLDLAAVALGAVGLLALARGRLVVSGVLLGLAISVRPFEVVLVVAIALVAWRRARLGAAGPLLVAAGLGFAAVNVPLALLSGAGWAAYWQSVLRAELSYGSVWLLPQVLGADIAGQRLPTPPLWAGSIGAFVVIGYLLVLAFAPPPLRERWRPRRVPWAIAALIAMALVPFAVVALGATLLPRLGHALPAGSGQWIAGIGYPLVLGVVAWVVARSPRAPRIAPVVLLLAVGWLFVSPAVPVQAGLWLLPLVVLTAPSWRLVLTWSAVEVGYGAITWLYLYGLSVDNRGAPAWVYLVFCLARWVALLLLGWRAWSLCWWPQDDRLRADLGDDPVAGPLAATDRVGIVDDVVEAGPQTR